MTQVTSATIKHVSFTALRCVLRGPTPVINPDGTQGWVPRTGRAFTDYDFLDTAGNPYTHQLWSKSAIEKFISCNRKWAFQWLAGIREPMGGAAQLGVDLHAEVEQWLVAGTPPTSKIITQSGVLEQLPMPGTPGLQAERVFALAVDWVVVNPDGTTTQHSSGFWGFKDISVGCDVWDLKSKGDLAYAMTDSELAEDLQACLYGLHACCETGSPTSTVTWAYIQTQGKPKYKPARATLTRDEMSRVVVKTLEYLTQMEQYRAQKIPALSPGSHSQLLQVMQVPPNPDSCAAYGGCFFRDSHCTDLKAGSKFLSVMKQERLVHQRHAAMHGTQPPSLAVPPNILSPAPVTTTQGTPKMSTPNPVLARIQTQLAARAAGTPGAPITNVAATVAAAPSIPVATQNAASVQAAQVAAATQPTPTQAATQPQAQAATQPAQGAAQSTPKPSVANKLAKLKDMLAKSQQEMAAGQVAAVTSTIAPAAATPAAEATSAQAAQEIFTEPTTQPAATEVLAQVEAAVDASTGTTSAAMTAAPSPAAAQPAAQPAPVKRSRGRPAGATNKPKPNLPLPVALSPEDAAWQARADQWPRNPHMVLFIDVLPVKGVELHNIDDLIAPVRAELEGDGEGGVGTNYRLVEFGKGPALLAALLEEHFKAEPPMGEFFVLSKLVDAPVMEVLVRFAREVVKGAW